MKTSHFAYQSFHTLISLWVVSATLGLAGPGILEAAPSLQAMVNAAAPGSVIIIPAGTYYGLVDIPKNLTLQGAGSGTTILDGQKTNSVLIIRPGISVLINDLTVTHGWQLLNQGGGGIKNFGHLTMNRCIVEDNYASFGTGASGMGGGIWSVSFYGPASLKLNDCTVRRNISDDGAGGGLYNGPGVAVTLNNCTVCSNELYYGEGGGIDGGDPLILNNCTVSGNRTMFARGAGIYATGMILNHCTITSNLCRSPINVKSGGIHGSVAECRNTIIAGNLMETSIGGVTTLQRSDCPGTTLISKGYNLIGDGTGATITAAAGDKIGTFTSPIDPKLGPLQNNGGPTLTHALLTGSPALDQASQGGLAKDQRGIARPYDYPAIANANDGSDIGAFELAIALPTKFMTIPSLGPAIPYPSSILISKLIGRVTAVKVTLNRLNHTWPADLNILLVGPAGQKCLLMGRAGYRYPLRDVTLQFQSSATPPLPQSSQIYSGTYQPTSYSPVRNFPTPAPPLPYATNLAVFHGTYPNGTWNLYVWDDSAGDEGYLADKWALSITTEVSPVPKQYSFTNSAAISILDNRAAAPYPSLINVAGLSGTISKATVTVRGLSHTWPGDILMLLVSPTGQKSYVMAKAGRNNRLDNVTLQFDDAASTRLSATGPIVSGTYKPTAYTTRSLVAPAPPAPYVTNLSVFNGKSPNGTWALYVMDDSAYDAGRIANGWSLSLTLAAAALQSVGSGGEWESTTAGLSLGPKSSWLWLETVKMEEDGTVRLRLHGQAGHRYALQASANGVDWQTVQIVDAVGDTVEVDDKAAEAVRFYRAVMIDP